MTDRIRHRIATGVAVATLLIVLNVAALTFGWNRPEIASTAIAVDIAGIALTFWLAWRQSLLIESRSIEQKRETARVQATLDDTEARYAAILESAMDAVITIDESQNVVLFNRAAEAMFGCPRDKALGRSLDGFLPERFRQSHHGRIEAFGSAGVTNRRMGHNTVLWALRSDGAEFPIEASISQARAAGGRLFTVIVRDITLRKQAEDALRRSEAELRELSARILEAREDEKTHIARELHDELGQQLTALKMDLAWIRERAPEEPSAFQGKLADMHALLDSTVAGMRRIATDLRPLMLDDLGLADAAEWLVEDFEQRSGVISDLDLAHPEDLSALERPVATALYRILQESLTNVIRHSGARRVQVTLGIEDGETTLTVQDDGRGITDADRNKMSSFGLKGLRERAHYLGGTAEVGAGPQGGTRVTVRLPVNPETSA